jgi:hypothetical protein
MSTYAAIKSRIADELSRSDLGSQISLSVQSAIKYHEQKQFWFNESRSLTFSTVANQEFYTSSDLSSMPNLLEIDHVTITVNSNRYEVTPRTYQYMEMLMVRADQPGQPTDYCYYAQQMRFYPIPDAAYTARISSRVRLGSLSADSDTNAWMTDGEALIRARAKWDLYINVLMDRERATEMAAVEQLELARLQRETGQRISTGKVMPTYF